MDCLHIIIKARMLIMITCQQPLCIRDAEILEVQQAMREVLAHQLNKSI